MDGEPGGGFETRRAQARRPGKSNMSATASATPLHRAIRFYEATNGKKAVMAVTGVVLFGYVAGHMAGNLQVFAGGGPDAPINRYARFLHSQESLLWGVRLVLLAAVAMHIVASFQLWRLNRAARGEVGYHKKNDVPAAYAARTMVWSGPILAAFIVFHVLHLTTGTVMGLERFEGMSGFNVDVYSDIVHGFQIWYISLAYIVAMVLLCLHLYHGLYSMFQSVGLNHPRYSPLLERCAKAFAILVAAGFISVPVAVMAGILR
jgi:succinate dehydrogenase / fumarate reductase cytochrome b subunit